MQEETVKEIINMDLTSQRLPAKARFAKIKGNIVENWAVD